MTWGGRRSRWGSEKEEAPRAISFTGIVKTILEVVPGGVLRAGKTAYADDANVGFWLGVDTDGVAKLNIGGALHYLKWTGTALVVAGDIKAGTVTGSVGVMGGEITWAGGKGRMDANGIAIRAASTAAGDRAYALEETNGADMAWYTAYSSFTFGGSEPGLASHLVLRSRGIDGVTAGAHARTQIEAHSTTGHAHVLLSPTNNAGELDIDIYVDGAGAPHSDFDGLVLGNIGDAAAAGDALNRRTADVRYAPLAGAHAAVTLGADADGLLELAGQQITLAAQGANQVFVGPVSGADAEPTFRVLAAADLPGASEGARGAVVLATQAEQEAGTSTGLVNRPAYNALRKAGAGWALGTGGRDRGAGACDLQQERSGDDFVASGPYALIAGGRDNAATCEAGHAEGVSTLAGGWLASYVYTCADRVMSGFSPALAAGRVQPGDSMRVEFDGVWLDGVIESVDISANALVLATDILGSDWESVVRFWRSASGQVGAHAEGVASHAEGYASHAEGNATRAEAQQSHAEGSNSHAKGWTSHAEGFATHADGYVSHAEGYASCAAGNYAHAEGNLSRVDGFAGHAEGDHTSANGSHSHAEGYYSVADAAYSHAEGKSGYASGGASHAEGADCRAEGYASHAAGSLSRARVHCQHAHAGGRFASTGDAQAAAYVLRRAITTHADTTWYALYLDGLSALLTIPPDSLWQYRVLVVGTTQGAAQRWAYRIEGAIVNDGGATALVGAPTVTILSESDPAYEAVAAADDIADALALRVRRNGGSNYSVRWVAAVDTVEVMFPA